MALSQKFTDRIITQWNTHTRTNAHAHRGITQADIQIVYLISWIENFSVFQNFVQYVRVTKYFIFLYLIFFSVQTKYKSPPQKNIKNRKQWNYGPNYQLSFCNLPQFNH